MDTWAVLGASFAVDGFVLHTAMKDVNKRAAEDNITPMAWLGKFKDPFTVAVVFEDSAAVVGVLIASVGIGMTHLTGNPVWDGISSICIAGLLAAVSLRLVMLNKEFIMGKPVDREITDGIRKILLRRRSVDAVYAAQTQWVGPSAFAYNAEVDFDGTYLAAQVYSRYDSFFDRNLHSRMPLGPCCSLEALAGV
jgi:zinc transporter 9